MKPFFFAVAIGAFSFALSVGAGATETVYNAKDSAGREPIHAKGFETKVERKKPTKSWLFQEQQCHSIETGQTFKRGTTGFQNCQPENDKK